MQCEYYALEGLSDLMDTLQNVQEMVNPDLHIEGLLRTMYDSRSRLTTEVSSQLLEHFREHVLDTIVPRNVRLAEAPSHGQSIVKYDKGSKGAQAYLALAEELIRRN
jgi:chromosome partitioning protein